MALSSQQMRDEWSEYRCKRNLDLQQIEFLRRSPVRIIDSWADAWAALESTLTSLGYPDDPSLGIVSSYACRPIADTAKMSLHSYKLAIDIHPPLNARQPDRRGQGNDWSRTLLTEEQCVAAEAIRFNNGEQAFVSGALAFRTPDAMHFQGAATKAGVASGVDWSTVQGADMPTTFVVGIKDARWEPWALLVWRSQTDTFWDPARNSTDIAADMGAPHIRIPSQEQFDHIWETIGFSDVPPSTIYSHGKELTLFGEMVRDRYAILHSGVEKIVWGPV